MIPGIMGLQSFSSWADVPTDWAHNTSSVHRK
jgi:hypothetical protein